MECSSPASSKVALETVLAEIEGMKYDAKKMLTRLTFIEAEVRKALKPANRPNRSGFGTKRKLLDEDVLRQSPLKLPKSATPMAEDDQHQPESDSSWTDEYDGDPDYTGPAYHSQPCFNKRGVSYTPPGFIRKRVKRKKATTPDTCRPSSPIDIDAALFGF